ncbi:MAG: hypothetical protein M9947_03760 [Thermomicrobiales bacterium]|nr:hypothetical protein [Thermomicrobiales bacterium]
MFRQTPPAGGGGGPSEWGCGTVRSPGAPRHRVVPDRRSSDVCPYQGAERLSAIEAALQDLLPRLALAPARTGRPEVLSAALLWTGMLVCIVRGQGSQLAIWRC